MPDMRYPAHAHHPDATTRVNALRIERGLTVRQLAARTKLGVRTINRLMAGSPCSPRVHQIVASALDVDPFLIWPHLMTHPDVQSAVRLARAVVATRRAAS